jgi:hypothetical protein
VEPSSLNFHTSEASKILTIINEGGGSLSWEIETEAGWLVCPMFSGETETSTTVEISINGKEMGDSNQEHEGTLTVFSNGGNYPISVTYIPSFTLTGFVYHRNLPDIIPLHGATITAYYGDSIFSTSSEQDGAYFLEDIPKSFDYIEVLKDGYLPSGISAGTKLVIPDNNVLVYDFYLWPDS